MVTVEYSEAVVEVLGILNELEEDEYNKIPSKIIDFFEENKSKSYNPNIDYTDDVQNLKLKEKTKEILAGIYLDYLCPEDEKENYIKKIKQNELKYQEELKEKYNVNDIFKNKKQLENNNSLIVVKEEKLFSKIINKIKNIFKNF